MENGAGYVQNRNIELYRETTLWAFAPTPLTIVINYKKITNVLKEEMDSEETLHLGVSNPSTNKQDVQPASVDIEIKRPTMPGPKLPSVNGVNVLSDHNDVNQMKTKLQSMGITVKSILYFSYGSASTLAFFYAQTSQGQYFLIESPTGVPVYGGGVSLNYQRVDVLQTNILEQFKTELAGIHTEYAFVCGGGIHHVKNRGEIHNIYGYDNYDSAKAVFDIKKYHFIVIPAVCYINLVDSSRLNTIEAYINAQDTKGKMASIMEKADLTRLLTMSGPFTFFMPIDSRLDKIQSLDPKRLQSVVLAHIVIGRIEHNTPTKEETLEYVSIAQNKITVVRKDGKIVSVSSGNQTAKVLDTNPVNKFNGLIYRIDAVFNPVSTEFTMPSKSDFDDVVTVFDINKSTMEIRRAQYAINRKSQETMFTLLEYISNKTKELYDEINIKSHSDGDSLIEKSNSLLTMFYDEDVLTKERTPKFQQLETEIRSENEEFERLLRVSNKFASLKVPLEKTLLKISRIDQQFHMIDEQTKKHL